MVYTGDLYPALTLELSDDAGPVDTTAATRVRVIAVRNNAVLFDRNATPSANGIITIPWEAADTSVAGDIFLEVQVTWGDGKPQTFQLPDPVHIKSSFSSLVP